MKLSDYLVEFLAKDLGIGHIFMIIGGANTHIADSIEKNKDIKHVCVMHEQAAAMAAEGYARVKGDMAAALVTSGPGGTNTITGVAGAWCDSVPCIFISGQVPLKLTTDGKTVRQLGVQQINIIDLVKPITKYAIMLD
ncbi:MAG: thiamine pyrophosphate-binding protein, partial [Parcubacteria group bacterium]|nr:thiamine pyrophosphate-binding protein [Parcubacteria group bacterium]